jgi:hypothetical protein
MNKKIIIVELEKIRDEVIKLSKENKNRYKIIKVIDDIIKKYL